MHKKIILLSVLVAAILPNSQIFAEDGCESEMQDSVFATRAALREVTLSSYTRADALWTSSARRQIAALRSVSV